MRDIQWHGPHPPCDFCGDAAPYDAPIRPGLAGAGSWANMCPAHLDSHAIDPDSQLVNHRITDDPLTNSGKVDLEDANIPTLPEL